MTTCDAVLAALVRGEPPAAEVAAHLEVCASCRADATLARRLGGALAADVVDEPSPGLSTRTLAAAAPLLAWNARRAAWRRLARAIAAALVPLPFVVALDVWLVATAYHVLHTVLPATVSVFVAGNYAALLALLLALTYGAVPILADRQGIRPEECHG